MLLKVNLDGQGGSGAFSAFVSILCVAPILLPIVLPFALQMYTAMVTKGEPPSAVSCKPYAPHAYFLDNFNICNVCETLYA